MANGDDALAAGMDIVLGTDDIRLVYDEENKTRDYIANLTADDIATDTSASVQIDLNFLGARIDSLVADDIPTNTSGSVQIDLDFLGDRIDGVEAYAVGVNANANNRLPYSGGVLTGHLYAPPARANPVTSGYVVCYLNGDGRLGAAPSALKYKRNIEDYEGSILGLRPVTYILKDDERETVRLGLIAEEANDVEPLLVVHEDGESESIKYELGFVALLKEVQRLAARVEALEGRDGEAP